MCTESWAYSRCFPFLPDMPFLSITVECTYSYTQLCSALCDAKVKQLTITYTYIDDLWLDLYSCGWNVFFSADPVHSNALLCLHTRTSVCFSKLGACWRLSAVGNTQTVIQAHLKKTSTIPLKKRDGSLLMKIFHLQSSILTIWTRWSAYRMLALVHYFSKVWPGCVWWFWSKCSRAPLPVRLSVCRISI